MLKENVKLANFIFGEDGARYSTASYPNWAAVLVSGTRKSILACRNKSLKVEGDLLNPNSVYSIAVLPDTSKQNAFFGLLLRLGEDVDDREMLSIGRGGSDKGLLYLILQSDDGTLLTFTVIENESNTLYSFSEAYVDKHKRGFKNILALLGFFTGTDGASKALLQNLQTLTDGVGGE